MLFGAGFASNLKTKGNRMKSIQGPLESSERIKPGRTMTVRTATIRPWQTSGEFVSSEDSIYWQVSDQVDALASTYEIANKDVLRAWTLTHPDALLALGQIPNVIGIHFTEADLKLEVKNDPEESGTPQLYVRIVTSMPVSEAVDAFMHVNEKLASRLRKVSDGNIVLTYDVMPA